MIPSYWLKLYLELMDDPKVLKMPDWLFRRMILLFLAAKENHIQHPEIKAGLLPSVADCSLRLRLKEEQINEALTALAILGVTTRIGPDWLITNFEKRQTPADKTAAERQRRHREKSVTEVTRDVTRDTSSSSLSSYSLSLKDKEFSEISTLYSNEIGELTRMSSEILSDAIEDYTADWIKAAIAEAVRQNARSWAYVEAILSRWKRDGFQSKKSRETAAPDAAWINVTELRLAEEARDA